MKKGAVLIGDIAILYASLLITLVIRYGPTVTRDAEAALHVAPFTILFGAWLVILYVFHLYELADMKNSLTFFSRILKTTFVNAIIAIIFFYFIPIFQITPKVNLVTFFIIQFILISSWRFAINKILASGSSKNNVVILGGGKQVEELRDYIESNHQIGYRISEIIIMNNEVTAADIVRTVQQKRARIVVISPDAYKRGDIINGLFTLVAKHIRFLTLAQFYEQATGKIPLNAIDQIWFLQNIAGEESRIYNTMKRIIDVVMSIIVIIMTLPFLIFAALGILVSSPGSLFYRQLRTGKNGKAFELIKFRSMPHNVEAKTGAVWATAGDMRATPFGKFLRKTRIDELPQILNVLKGDLSFVGPRPERPEFHDKLVRTIPFYDKRYLVTPGLTGWAQIKYKLDFEGGMTIEDTAEKVKHDLYYIKNRNIMLDIGIMLQTFYTLARKVIG